MSRLNLWRVSQKKAQARDNIRRFPLRSWRKASYRENDSYRDAMWCDAAAYFFSAVFVFVLAVAHVCTHRNYFQIPYRTIVQLSQHVMCQERSDLIAAPAPSSRIHVPMSNIVHISFNNFPISFHVTCNIILFFSPTLERYAELLYTERKRESSSFFHRYYCILQQIIIKK